MGYLLMMNTNKENKKSKYAKEVSQITPLILNKIIFVFIFLSSLNLFQKILSYLNYLRVSRLFL